MQLIVLTPFNGHETGTTITDPKEQQEILSSEWAQYVTKIADPAPGASGSE